MASDPLASARAQIGRCVAEVRERGPRLSPLDLHSRMDQIRQIAETKLVDLNARDVDQAMKIVEGTARSMGVEVPA